MSEIITVLIIENEQETLNKIKRFLSEERLTLLPASDLKSGLEMIYLYKPDIVIINEQTYPIEGKPHYSTVKKDPKLQDTFFIGISKSNDSTPSTQILANFADVSISYAKGNSEFQKALKLCLRTYRTERQLKVSNDRLAYLKQIILTLQNINRLISKLSDKKELIEKACSILVKDAGYQKAWIVILDVKNNISEIASSGFEHLKNPVLNELSQKTIEYCKNLHFGKKDILCIEDPISQCSECPLSAHFENSSLIIASIKANEDVFGWFMVPVPKMYANDEIQLQILSELATDLGIAILNMELQAIQKQVIKSRDEYANMAALSEDLMVVINIDAIVKLANPAACRFFNAKEEDIVGNPIEGVIGKALFDKYGKNFKKKILQGKSVSFLAEIPFKQNRKRYLNVRCIPDTLNGLVEHICILGTDITDIIKTKKKLENSEQRYRNLYEHIPSGVALIKANNCEILEVNDVICEMLGYSQKELIGKSLKEIALSDEIEKDTLKQGLKSSNRRNSIERILQKKDGSEIWTTITTTPIKYKKSTPQTLLGIITDNTALVKTSQALEQSQQHYRILAENYENGVLSLFDRDFRYVFIEGKALEKVGYPKHDLIGKTIYEVFPKELYLTMEDAWKKVFLGETISYTIEIECVVFLVYATPIFEENGSIKQGAGIAQDITELQKYQRLLQKKQTLHEILEELSAIGSFELDFTTDEMRVSRGWRRIHGFETNIISIQDFLKIVYPEDLPQIQKAFQDAADGISENRLEHRILHHQTGDLRQLKVIGKVEYSHQGMPEKMIGSVQDITEQKLSEEENKKIAEELRHKQKMETIGQLAGGVAHDFNNIMQSIIGFSQLLMSNFPETSQEYDHSFEIFQSAERATSLTRQLLAFSRRQILEPSELDINTHILSLMDMLNRTTEEHIEVLFEPSQDLPHINVDEQQFTQIILNLVLNSRDAMPDGGEIRLKTSRVKIDSEFNETYFTTVEKPDEGEYIALEVTDTGRGIPKEVIDKIFEPFFTTKSFDKGTGLGLSSVFGIMRQHNGAIRVFSKEGEGASFYLYFPALVSSPPIASETRFKTTAPERVIGTVLFAEDDPVLRKLANKVLGGYGFSLLLAKDGKEAEELGIENIHSIDILVLDAVMPKKSGVEVYKVLSELRPELPVIFTSGYTESEIQSNFILQQGLSYLQKPYSLTLLLNKIQELLSKPD